MMFFIETIVQRITTVQNRAWANSSNHGNPIGGPVNRRGSKPGVEGLWYRRSRQKAWSGTGVGRNQTNPNERQHRIIGEGFPGD